MGMPVAEVTVKYINQPKPGKKMGSIKTTGDEYYNVWPDKLHMFHAGQNYTIEYDQNEQGFKSFKKLVGGSGAQQVGTTAVVTGNMAAARAQAPTRSGDAKSEEMFVMGFMNRCYQGAGTVPPHSQLVIELRTLRSAWQEAWAPSPASVRPSAATQEVVPDDLNDDIPF
jgi:hypothetical protein